MPEPKESPQPAQEEAGAPADDKPGKQTQSARRARPKEIGGPDGPEPTRYGDWERNGRCSDF